MDDDGRCWPCRNVARVVTMFDQDSTSGPLLMAVVVCDVKHRNHVLFEDLDLLA